MKRFLPILFFVVVLSCADSTPEVVFDRPNILIAISDDQSFPHASAYGSKMVLTPNFDQIAASGILFNNAFTASPGCGPSRAALLTGRFPWQLEHAGTHASYFSPQFRVLPDIMEEQGYHVGFTGKGWGPGDWAALGRTRNPAGPEFSEIKLDGQIEGISRNNYSANFEEFLAVKNDESPFLFWFGAEEPHRSFAKGGGLENGKNLDDAEIPPFLPDSKEIRSDLLDYSVEIESFDRQLGKMIDLLQSRGELDNTIIIVTSDNGMAFPGAKANVYEYGIHVPLAISWPAGLSANQVIDEIVNQTDLAPTLLGLTQLNVEDKFGMSGRDITTFLTDRNFQVLERGLSYSGRERHSSSRYQSLGYPQRAVRTDQFLYIRNFRPERAPAGAPQAYRSGRRLGRRHGAYHDIDASPSLDFLVKNRNRSSVKAFFEHATEPRSAEELYDIKNDPGCLENLASNFDFFQIKNELSLTLASFLERTNDPRIGANEEIFESYPRVSQIREFPKPSWTRGYDPKPSNWLVEKRNEDK